MKLCIKLRILILQTVQCTQCVHLHTGEKCIDAHSAYDSAFLFLSSAGCGVVVVVGRSGCINALYLHLGKGSRWVGAGNQSEKVNKL